MNNLKGNKYLNLALILVSLFLLTKLATPFFYITRIVGKILLPFLIAFGLAFVLQPIVRFLEKKFKLKKLVAEVLVLVMVILLFGFLLLNVVPLVVSQLSNIFGSLEVGLNSILEYLKGGTFENILSEPAIQSFVEKLGTASTNFISGVFSSVGVIVMIPILFLYFFFGFDRVKNGLNKMLIKFKYYKLYAYLTKLEELTVTYLGGLAITISVLSLLASVAFMLIGLEKGAALGILIGLSTIIPYFGAFISGAFAVIVALGSSVKLALITLVVIILVQFIEGNLITPNIQAKSFSLHPLAILLSITISSTFLGFAGMLLAIPLLLAFKLFFTMYIEPKILKSREGKEDILEEERIKYNIPS